MGKLSESEPTHHLPHLSQDPMSTHARVHTHVADIQRQTIQMASVSTPNIKPNFLNTSQQLTSHFEIDAYMHVNQVCSLHFFESEADHRLGQRWLCVFEHSVCYKDDDKERKK